MKQKEKKLPLKIDPCPIKEAIIEIRFTSKLHPDAVFGVFYEKVKKYFPKVEKQPIANIPELSSKNPFAPHYKLLNDKFVLLLGPRVLALTNKDDYVGWQKFSEKAGNCFNIARNVGLIEKVERLGLRYVDFFEHDIFQDVKIQTLLDDKKFKNNGMTIKTSFQRDKFSMVLQISNTARIKGMSDKAKSGSVIDIDTYINQNGEKNISNQLKKLIEKAHSTQKKLFFQELIIEDNFYKKFKPIWR